MKEKQFESNKESLIKIQTFMDSWFEENSVDMMLSTKISLCSDEILSNIVFYSGASFIKIQCEKTESDISITFIDDGKAFNPLTDSVEPDTTSAMEEREIGGLGIFIVKKMMNSVDYERENELNKLAIRINF